MVFSSSVFIWLFLPVVFLLNYFIKPQYSNPFLLLASLIFYAFGEPVLVLLMLAYIVVNHAAGVCMDRFLAHRKLILVLAVGFDLSWLFYYKYLGLFVDLVNDICGKEILAPFEIALPIGISFFTFQAISYVADVYRGETDSQKNLMNTALYIAFFPQLIAGPIVKYKEINEQLMHREISKEGVALGFRRFVYGLAKKVLIANVLGECVDKMYGIEVGSMDGIFVWVVSLMYTFQIYYDFSGYSDMAIGLGSMFGFRIPENFRYPYFSTSVTEFWRRWHISLGSWFREYLYIPLGGNRKGRIRTYVNLLVVFLFTGFWHGANVSYVFWGAFYGLFIVLERAWLGKMLEKVKPLAWIYLFLIVNFGWVIFRMEDVKASLRVIHRMLMPWKYMSERVLLADYITVRSWWIFAIGIVGCGFLPTLLPKRIKAWWNTSLLQPIFCLILFVLCMASLAGEAYNPFIYFQF